ncbi:MAG: pyridoxal phosphate-dependent aminotransferase [Gammaproteobacteria bacterium]|nr:pyridoxal phosphate-dependent aminotransferase [Gammaproteobacteria bacterium]
MASHLPTSEVSRRLECDTADVWQIHSEALARAEQGENILMLSVGDPDFPTPPDIAAYLVQQVEHGRTHYSPAGGEPLLLDALANLETRIEDRPFDAAQFTVFPGGTAALFATFACIIDPGDEIVVPEPMYIGYRSIFAAIGASVVIVPLEAGTFDLSIDALEARVAPRTRAVLLNTPGNPCGNIIDGETLHAAAAMCRDRSIWLICDEVYSMFTYDEDHVSALKVAEHLDNVIVIRQPLEIPRHEWLANRLDGRLAGVHDDAASLLWRGVLRYQPVHPGCCCVRPFGQYVTRFSKCVASIGHAAITPYSESKS